MTRLRVYAISGFTIGRLPTGTYNAITDVPGVWVGHRTLVYDHPQIARTGVTVVMPRCDTSWKDHLYAGYHSLNGNGEMTGLLWLEESGLLGSPVALTNTHQVGVVRDALAEYFVTKHQGRGFHLPVVSETWDGWLNDINAFHVTREHVFDAIATAESGPVAEGNVGGGTGMICHGFKGGIGTASRVVEAKSGRYTVGVLVQANYGDRRDLRVNGIPVGVEIGPDRVPLPWTASQSAGSIVVIIATDAPLIASQCKRLARRAAIGIGRVGAVGHNSSGDIFLAFATGNHIYADAGELLDVHMVPQHHIDPFFQAVIEAVEESILNALAAAETMVGFKDRKAYALPLDELQRVMASYGK